jgi:hypothetical protein
MENETPFVQIPYYETNCAVHLKKVPNSLNPVFEHQISTTYYTAVVHRDEVEIFKYKAIIQPHTCKCPRGSYTCEKRSQYETEPFHLQIKGMTHRNWWENTNVTTARTLVDTAPLTDDDEIRQWYQAMQSSYNNSQSQDLIQGSQEAESLVQLSQNSLNLRLDTSFEDELREGTSQTNYNA